MGKDIEVQRRRKGAPPTGRADAPQRETGGSPGGGGFGSPPGGGFPRPSGGMPSRGRQIGGCGSILFFIVIIAFYLLLAVQATSYSMKRMSRTAWRRVHLTSFAAFWLVSLHGAAAGTDATSPWYRVFSVAAIAIVMLLGIYRVLTPRRRRAATA